MHWFKMCLRCARDLFEESGQYGHFVTCMQSGFSKDAVEPLTDPDHINLDPIPAPLAPQFERGKRRRISHGGRHFARTLYPGDEAP